ncbi:unnamed protein product [Cyprideis torosa]|uniref:Uncharacterized protein n=1 Tax=Cyprideis torosa TaxID=163714 RepID=A0A7R8ZIM2_9CRUS|nr:unnamed protein product [Cyprideis torosa]CAG0880284.1 unnamed protein product [Cyprideis torosa]
MRSHSGTRTPAPGEQSVEAMAESWRRTVRPPRPPLWAEDVRRNRLSWCEQSAESNHLLVKGVTDSNSVGSIRREIERIGRVIILVPWNLQELVTSLGVCVISVVSSCDDVVCW